MTIQLALIRHGPTDWNGEKRLQGRSDRPLSDSGRATVSSWQLPAELRNFEMHCSPLRRATETARLLLGRSPSPEDALTEMSYGDWEGRRLPDLRTELGQAMSANEERGLDFTPPGGESPRMVFDRLLPLFRDWASSGRDRLAVTHKGVIRAVYANAVGWDMTGRSPDKLHWDAAHLFELNSDGMPRPVRLNLSLIV